MIARHHLLAPASDRRRGSIDGDERAADANRRLCLIEDLLGAIVLVVLLTGYLVVV